MAFAQVPSLPNTEDRQQTLIFKLALNSFLSLQALNILAGVTTLVDTFTSTSSGGAGFVAFPNVACSSFRFFNDTTVILEIRTVNGSVATEKVQIDASIPYPCVASMSEWEWKRQDNGAAKTITGALEG